MGSWESGRLIGVPCKVIQMSNKLRYICRLQVLAIKPTWSQLSLYTHTIENSRSSVGCCGGGGGDDSSSGSSSSSGMQHAKAGSVAHEKQ